MSQYVERDTGANYLKKKKRVKRKTELAAIALPLRNHHRSEHENPTILSQHSKTTQYHPS